MTRKIIVCVIVCCLSLGSVCFANESGGPWEGREFYVTGQTVTYNGEPVAAQVGRCGYETMVQLVPLANKAGYSVSFEEDTNKVVVFNDDIWFAFELGMQEVEGERNGVPFQEWFYWMPQIYEDRVYIGFGDFARIFEIQFYATDFFDIDQITYSFIEQSNNLYSFIDSFYLPKQFSLTGSVTGDAEFVSSILGLKVNTSCKLGYTVMRQGDVFYISGELETQGLSNLIDAFVKINLAERLGEIKPIDLSKPIPFELYFDQTNCYIHSPLLAYYPRFYYHNYWQTGEEERSNFLKKIVNEWVCFDRDQIWEMKRFYDSVNQEKYGPNESMRNIAFCLVDGYSGYNRWRKVENGIGQLELISRLTGSDHLSWSQTDDEDRWTYQIDTKGFKNAFKDSKFLQLESNQYFNTLLEECEVAITANLSYLMEKTGKLDVNATGTVQNFPNQWGIDIGTLQTKFQITGDLVLDTQTIEKPQGAYKF